MNERTRLSDILRQPDEREKLASLWKQTAAAEEFSPIPHGEYTFRILSGELFTSKNGTAGYKLKLQVTEGDFEGRLTWHDLWLTPAALPMTKRDLAKLGIAELSQIEKPIPPGILVKGKVARRTDDNGNESNQLKRFEFVGVEPGDAFEPPPADQGKTSTEELFPFGANAPPSTNGDHKPQRVKP